MHCCMPYTSAHQVPSLGFAGGLFSAYLTLSGSIRIPGGVEGPPSLPCPSASSGGDGGGRSS